jgi:hypothetical protein
MKKINSGATSKSSMVADWSNIVLINVRYLVIINGSRIGHQIYPSQDIAQN